MKMPHLVYLATDDTFTTRLKTHPERLLALWWGLLGFLLSMEIIFGDRQFDGTLSNFHWPIALGVGLILLVSGACILYVSLRRSDSAAWRYERLGWILGIGGWVTYGGALVNYGSSFLSWSLPIAFILVSLVRLSGLRKTERTIRKKAGRE